MRQRLRQGTSHARRCRPIFTGRRFRLSAGIILGLFVLANVAMSALYHNKALPGYAVGDLAIGGKTYAQIGTMLDAHALPHQVTLVKDSADQQIAVDDLGISINQTKTLTDVKHKPIFPVFSLLSHHTVPLVISGDQGTIARYLDQFTFIFTKPATDRHIAFTGSEFAVQDAAGGYNFDKSETATAIISGLAKGKTTIIVATNSTPAGTNSGDLSADITVLNKQLQSKVTLAYQDQTIQPTVAEMGGWYTASGQTMTLSDTNISSYIDTLMARYGGSAANKSDLILAIKYALGKNLSYNFRISPQGAAVRTYCTAAKGVSSDGLSDLTGKLAATYADTRGWNDSGLVAFKHVDSGCQYTVWLAAPAQMTSFGSICDNYYNCQVGTNVVVNNDRWLYATDPWNKTGQDIETYRLLIINHETGHRLGFRDNNVCPGAGQPAPVMMQQSIVLNGCKFNVWPTSAELTLLKSML